VWIEPFFGAGGMFFNLTNMRKYNIVNDNDAEVYNLYTVLVQKPTALKKALELMPIDENLWRSWKTKQEKDPVMKAVRFLFLSNFGYMGKPETLRINASNSKQIMIDNLGRTQEMLKNVQIANDDFRRFLKVKIKAVEPHRGFIYCDPPYLASTNNYQSSFTEKDSKALFAALSQTKMRWAISEFDNPIILAEAKRRGLQVVEIGTRQNMKNERTEILVINYDLKTFKKTRK
jgi:DNA adenine methylase